MHASILTALLVSVTTVNAEHPSSPKPEVLKCTVGAMSFTGDSIKLTKSDSTSFQCEIEGHARLTLGDDTDAAITLAASRMTIVRNADSTVTVRCVDDCKLTDSDHAITADQIKAQFNDRMEIEMTGHVQIVYGVGESRTTLTGDSVVIRDGAFAISGDASLKRGE